MSKKIKMLVVVAVAVMSLSSVFALVGCSQDNSKFLPQGENLASGGVTITYDNGKTAKTLSFSSKKASEINFKFDAPKRFNTITIEETQKVKAVRDYEWWTSVNGEEKMLYKQDEIGKLRYCSVGDITTDNLKLKIKATDAKYSLRNFGLYNSVRKQEDFRVVNYVTGRHYIGEGRDKEALNHVTDVIIFGAVSFDENAVLSVDHETIDTIMANIKTDIKGKMPRILIAVLQRGISDAENAKNERTKQDIYNSAMTGANRDKLISQIDKLITDKGVDGVGFDYEFPYTKEDFKNYSNFLIELDKAMKDKIISIAVADWNMGISKEAIEAVDYFEVMGYDMWDERGNHSNFESAAVKLLNNVTTYGVPRSKVNLGIPFYALPTDHQWVWIDYRAEAHKLGEFGNIAPEDGEKNDSAGKPLKPRYFNGAQMIKDKTAFAYDNKLGGMMIWQYACDLPYSEELSLLRAMNSVFDK